MCRRYFTKIISGRYHFQIGFTESHEVEQNDKNKGWDEEGAGSGKIKKSKEIRKGLPTLTFSGGWVNNARGIQQRRAGMNSQSATIKRHGCVYSGICLFPPFPPLTTRMPWDFYLIFRRRSRLGIYILSALDRRGGRVSDRRKQRERRVDEEVGRITMQLFSFQLVNGF